jgi:hypothetical protein
MNNKQQLASCNNVQNKVKKFNIYHSFGINKFEEVENQERIYVGDVEANTLEEAFQRSQNGGIYNTPNSWSSEALPWNLTDPCRSTSVGDVIKSDEGFYMVCGMGFRLLDVMSKNESDLNSLESATYEG